MRKFHPAAAAIAAATLFVAGCGGNDSLGTGQMKLSVADAPVDDASAVVVKFTGVTLTNDAGDPVTITFPSPKSIDLMDESETGRASAILFDSPIPSGHYGQIRLDVVADGDPANSFITLQDGDHGLVIPSGAETGLKLISGFDVPDAGVVAYTIDFDLRKSITCPNGQNNQCFLRPTLRLVADDSVGNITGNIDPSLMPQGCSPAVYLYSGSVTTPEDYNSNSTAGDPNQPVASTIPNSSTNPQTYQFTFLAPGDYTVALTCQASSDDPTTPDGSVTFNPIASAHVDAGATTTVDLVPASP